MQEEIGINLPIKYIDTLHYVDTTRGGKLHKFLGIFEAFYEGPFSYGEDEVEEVRFFSLDQIKKMVEKGKKFHPELLFLLEKLYF